MCFDLPVEKSLHVRIYQYLLASLHVLKRLGGGERKSQQLTRKAEDSFSCTYTNNDQNFPKCVYTVL